MKMSKHNEIKKAIIEEISKAQYNSHFTDYAIRHVQNAIHMAETNYLADLMPSLRRLARTIRTAPASVQGLVIETRQMILAGMEG
jgi:uncharacterized protein (DUF305 family)